MINIYPADTEDFSTLGLAVLQPTECTVEEKAGGLMELEMKHPVDDDLKWTYLQNGCIIKAPCAVRATTGPEIWNDTDGEVDIFVAGVGTGGTLTGVGEYLKSQKADVKVVAIEPATSPVLSEGKAGAHKIQGIGAGFVPDVLNTKVYDEIITIENDDAFATSKQFGKSEGILVGISSGAALKGAIELAKRPENKGKTIVALLPDSGDRYYSTPLFID